MGFNSLRRFLTNDKLADSNICFLLAAAERGDEKDVRVRISVLHGEPAGRELRQCDVFVSSPFCFLETNSQFLLVGK